MRKIWILVSLLILINSSLFSVVLYFRSGALELTPESKKDIVLFKQQFEEFFEENPKTLIFVTGHTDDKGTPEENKALSLSRANLIRDYLVDELKIDPKYILIYGRGSHEPLASNETAAGRNMNRRVEIVFESPEAQLGWIHDQVEHIRAISGDSQPAQPNDYLFRNDQIKTGKYGEAAIDFRNKNRLLLQENGLLVIYGDVSSAFADLLDDTYHVELKYGNLNNTLENLNGKSLNIRTPAADLQLYSNLHKLEHRNEQTLLYLYEGYGIVLAAGRSVRVEAGSGVKIQQGNKPEDPVLLPLKPYDLNISETDPLIRGRRIQLNWSGSSPRYLVQISADQNFNKIKSQAYVETEEIKLELDFGNYFSRIRALGDYGLKSDFSETFPLEVTDEEFIICNGLMENTVMSSSRPLLDLQGTALDKIKVFINGEETPVSRDLTFSRQIPLEYGINGIQVTALLPDGNEEKYFYRVSFSPPLDKKVIFHNLRSDIVNNTEKKKILLQAEASEYTRMFISNKEITRASNGLFEQFIKLKNGINELTVTVKFIDGSEEDHRFEIIYDKQKSGISSLEIIAAITILLATATPFIVNAILY